jgi:hypothetical protein
VIQVPPRPGWWKAASCRGSDLFFSEGQKKIEKAKAICAICSVKPECLQEAMELPEHLADYGVRAGLSSVEIRLARKRHKTLKQETGT